MNRTLMLYGRDRFVLSKCHVCPALYAVLADCGYFEEKELRRLL